MTLQAGRPFLGICLGLQVLYQGSQENGGVEVLTHPPNTDFWVYISINGCNISKLLKARLTNCCLVTGWQALSGHLPGPAGALPGQ